MCNFINSLIPWVHSFTESYLSDTDANARSVYCCCSAALLLIVLLWQCVNTVTYFLTYYYYCLHWLPVSQRIPYKVAAAAFNYIRGTSPAYFKHVCTPASDICGRAHIRSAERSDMLVPGTELSSVDGVFQLLDRPSGTLFRHTCARH